jgi:hypothetical protein
VKFESHGRQYEIMIRYLAVMSRKNLLEAGGSSKTPMSIYLSTRRHNLSLTDIRVRNYDTISCTYELEEPAGGGRFLQKTYEHLPVYTASQFEYHGYNSRKLWYNILHLWVGRIYWRREVPPKGLCLSTCLHGVTSRATVFISSIKEFEISKYQFTYYVQIWCKKGGLWRYWEMGWRVVSM